MKTKIIILLVLGAFAVTGCSQINSSSFHNIPVSRELKLKATRIDSPGNFPAAVRMCEGREGIYTAESSGGSVYVVPNDPNC